MGRYRHLTHVLGIAAGFALAAVAWIALWHAQLGHPTWQSRWVDELYRDKIAIAEAVAGPRVLILGGSSPLFAVRASELTRALGVPVINLGTHAGLDLDYLLYRARRIVRRGDVVLMVLEYEHYARDPHKVGVDLVDHAFARDLAYFGQLPLDRQAGAILRMDLTRALKPWTERGPAPSTGPFGTYERDILDAHGDTLANNPVLKTAATRARLDSLPPLRPGVRRTSLAMLRAFHEWCRARGVEVLAAPGPLMWKREYDAPAFIDGLEAIARWHRESGVPLLLEPRSTIATKELFFDSNYHLDAAAATRHSARLAQVLAKRLVASTGSEWSPRAPAHALAQLDAAFRGWEPLSGFGPVEGPYPQWNLGGVIWALGERSILAARALPPGTVQVTASVRAAAPGQRLAVSAGGKKVYETVFDQATEFVEIAFGVDVDRDPVELQLVHTGNARPQSGPHHALLIRSLRVQPR